MSNEATLIIEIRTNEDAEQILLGLMQLLAWNNHEIVQAAVVSSGGFLDAF